MSLPSSGAVVVTQCVQVHQRGDQRNRDHQMLCLRDCVRTKDLRRTECGAQVLVAISNAFRNFQCDLERSSSNGCSLHFRHLYSSRKRSGRSYSFHSTWIVQCFAIPDVDIACYGDQYLPACVLCLSLHVYLSLCCVQLCVSSLYCAYCLSVCVYVCVSLYICVLVCLCPSSSSYQTSDRAGCRLGILWRLLSQ